MKFNIEKPTIKNTPKISTTIYYLVLIALAISLHYFRKSDIFPFAFLRVLIPEYHLHISNLSISYVLYAGTGFVWIRQGVPFKYIKGLGIALVLANLIYEIWIPFINTLDIVDAGYGIVGTLLGYLFLFIMQKHGIKKST